MGYPLKSVEDRVNRLTLCRYRQHKEYIKNPYRRENMYYHKFIMKLAVRPLFPIHRYMEYTKEIVDVNYI